MKSRTIPVLIAALMLVLAACGGDDAATDTGTDPAPDATQDTGGDDGAQSSPQPEADDGGDDSAPPAADPPAVGEMGSFTVNGTEFAVTFLNRCVPFSGGDSVIDLQPIAQGQGAQLNLYGAGGDSDEVSVQGSTIQDMFGSIAFSSFGPEESTITGDRWTGTATLEDAAGSGADPVTVVWDVMVPPEAQEC